MSFDNLPVQREPGVVTGAGDKAFVAGTRAFLEKRQPEFTGR